MFGFFKRPAPPAAPCCVDGCDEVGTDTATLALKASTVALPLIMPMCPWHADIYRGIFVRAGDTHQWTLQPLIATEVV